MPDKYSMGVTSGEQKGGFFRNIGGFLAERSEFAGFLRDRRSRMLAEAAEQERAQLVSGSLESWNDTMTQKLQGLARPDDQAQLQTLIKQGNLAYSYAQSAHPELRQVGQQLLGEVLKAERDFDIRQEAEARSDAAQQAAQKAAIGEQAWQRLNTVADDMIRESTPFIEQRAAMGRIKASLLTPSAAGDLSLIFNYMKLLDPGSVVRESEFANAQNMAGVPDFLVTLRNRIRGGERLTPAERADFYGQAQALYKQAISDQSERNSRYAERARDGGVPENMIDSLLIPTGIAGPVPQSFGQDVSEDKQRDNAIEGVGAMIGADVLGKATGLDKVGEAIGGTAADIKEWFAQRAEKKASEIAKTQQSQSAQKYRASGRIERDSAGRTAAEALQAAEEANAKALEEAGRLYTTPRRRR